MSTQAAVVGNATDDECMATFLDLYISVTLESALLLKDSHQLVIRELALFSAPILHRR